MLPDSPDVELVYAGENGIFAGAKAGALLIDMSSISPVVARKLAAEAEKRGFDMIDAPVSGGEAGAIGATLSIMIGGKASAVERAMPIFQVLGKNIVHVGDAGAGQVTKAANQMVVGTTIAIVSEALVLAAKAGVDPAKVRQALLGGFAQSKILEAHGQKMLDRNFKPGFRIRLHEKDMKIALADRVGIRRSAYGHRRQVGSDDDCDEIHGQRRFGSLRACQICGGVSEDRTSSETVIRSVIPVKGNPHHVSLHSGTSISAPS